MLFFLDSDITVTPSTLSAVAASFADRPQISALFCSYQKETVPEQFLQPVQEPGSPLHSPDGPRRCGYLLRRVWRHPPRRLPARWAASIPSTSILEDVELGYRLHRAGHKIFLNKSIQLTHHKKYSFTGLVKSDLLGRAIPWTRIMLTKRIIRNDLNTRSHNMLSVVVALAIARRCRDRAVDQPVGLRRRGGHAQLHPSSR